MMKVRAGGCVCVSVGSNETLVSAGNTTTFSKYRNDQVLASGVTTVHGARGKSGEMNPLPIFFGGERTGLQSRVFCSGIINTETSWQPKQHRPQFIAIGYFWLIQ